MNRDQILGRKTIKSEAVPVPEWEGTVHIRGMSGSERDAFEAENSEIKEAGGTVTTNLRARLLVRCLCHESGELIFKTEDAEQFGSEQDGALIIRLFEIASKLNGMDKLAEEKAAGK